MASASHPAASASDVWLPVADDLLSGVNHALSNRLAALISIARILEQQGTGTDPMLRLLTQEVEHLERTVALLRLLPRDPEEQPQPLRLVDVVPDLLSLHRLQSEAREFEVSQQLPDELPPVVAEPIGLGRALLLLLAAASHCARQLPAPRASIIAHAVGEHVIVAVDCPPARVESRDWPSLPPDAWPPQVRAAALLLREAGGELTRYAADAEAAGGLHVELRLPTLAAVRRREGRGEG